MLERLTALHSDLAALVASFDPDLIEGADAARLVEAFAAIEKTAAAGKVHAARRVEEANAFRATDRTADEWLARTTGIDVGEARGLLAAARQLEQLPETDRAFRAGRLSEEQARHVAAGAAADGAAEDDLLRVAEAGNLKRLRDRSRHVQINARREDEEKRAARHQAARSVRTWTDADGMGCGQWRLPPVAHARLLRRLEIQRKVLAGRAAKAGDTLDQVMADALVAVVDAGPEQDNEMPTSRAAGRLEGVLLVDLAALRRGHTEGDERCEIDGVGPIPTAAARDLLGDAALSIVLREATDIKSVITLGREFTRAQKLALIARDPTCIRPGCATATGLEFEHRDGYANTLVSVVSSAARVCGRDHYLKTHHGHTYRGQPGHWEWDHGNGFIEYEKPPDAPDPPDSR